jgi:hypothetical protein
MKELSSHSLAARRVRGSWIVVALCVGVGGLTGAVFTGGTSVVGVVSLLVGGLGALAFVTLLGTRLEQDRQAEKYGTGRSDTR